MYRTNFFLINNENKTKANKKRSKMSVFSFILQSLIFFQQSLLVSASWNLIGKFQMIQMESERKYDANHVCACLE